MTAPGNKPPRTSRLGRTMTVGAAAARMGMRAAQHRLQSEPTRAAGQAAHEAAQGETLFSALSQLKGTALKASQLLSMADGLLPPALREALGRATHQAVPLNRALVSRAFRQALGQEPQALFAHFEPEAAAAASLGQVHRARLHDGTAVAVKVQYPGIAQTLETDLRLLRMAVRPLLHGVQGDSAPALEPSVLDTLLHEIAVQLRTELDYGHEAAQQAWFAQHTAHAGLRMAQPVPGLSTATVLTQTWLPGQHLDAWLQTEPPAAWRDRAGQTLFDWFFQCAFEHGHIHGDLHPGNLLFDDDGVVGVLDFGCTRRLSPAFVQVLAQAWVLWLGPDDAADDAVERTRRHALQRLFTRAGWVDAAMDEATFQAHAWSQIAPVLAWSTQPLVASSHSMYDFTLNSPFPARPQPGETPPHGSPDGRPWMGRVPPEMLSFDRSWYALRHVLQRLGARVDTRAAWQRLRAAAQPDASAP
jgi:predicted unusual protein kinase regulating ubiquinone biosynthesis (AarF/ABC1/UbiB family)